MLRGGGGDAESRPIVGGGSDPTHVSPFWYQQHCRVFTDPVCHSIIVSPSATPHAEGGWGGC